MKTINIETEILYENNGDKSHYINTDEKRFKQVLLNLINNAIQNIT